ncbi:MAG: lasso RiPP family leader peptide-containing protein [Pseudonocardiaceae bacterium]
MEQEAQERYEAQESYYEVPQLVEAGDFASQTHGAGGDSWDPQPILHNWG